VGISGDARACGGCFAPQQSGTVVTDHKMIFAISQTQTTLYDQIEYTGAPQSFAWVLPTHGVVTIGLSSDALFQTLEANTRTTIIGPRQTFCGNGPSGGFSSGTTAPVAAEDAGVIVTAHQVVGPYETVQLKSSDPTALSAWLGVNGYSIPPSVTPVIAAYVDEGFDFLALRLVPGAGVSAMKPVSVTSPGAGLSLPLRMVAAGTGARVGMTLWVLGQGRYEPKNFLQFLIEPSEITWDFNAGGSDYSVLQQQKEQGLNYAAWQIESSQDFSPYTIESNLLADSTGAGYSAIPATDAGGADGGPTTAQTADQVRQQDLATLFASGPGTVRITRMRADLSQAALADDLELTAASDQSTISNIYTVTNSVNATVCGPGGSGSSGFGDGSGSSSGGVGSGSSAGSGSSGSSSASSGGAPEQSSGCAIGPVGAAAPDVDLALAGLVGLALMRTRRGRASTKKR
jgi:hypothetical protein